MYHLKIFGMTQTGFEPTTSQTWSGRITWQLCTPDQVLGCLSECLNEIKETLDI